MHSQGRVLVGAVSQTMTTPMNSILEAVAMTAGMTAGERQCGLLALDAAAGLESQLRRMWRDKPHEFKAADAGEFERDLQEMWSEA